MVVDSSWDTLDPSENLSSLSCEFSLGESISHKLVWHRSKCQYFLLLVLPTFSQLGGFFELQCTLLTATIQATATHPNTPTTVTLEIEKVVDFDFSQILVQ